jgi:hypothetical protein
MHISDQNHCTTSQKRSREYPSSEETWQWVVWSVVKMEIYSWWHMKASPNMIETNTIAGSRYLLEGRRSHVKIRVQCPTNTILPKRAQRTANLNLGSWNVFYLLFSIEWSYETDLSKDRVSRVKIIIFSSSMLRSLSTYKHDRTHWEGKQDRTNAFLQVPVVPIFFKKGLVVPFKKYTPSVLRYKAF